MELGSYFVSARSNKDIIYQNSVVFSVKFQSGNIEISARRALMSLNLIKHRCVSLADGVLCSTGETRNRDVSQRSLLDCYLKILQLVICK
jgi:hypothetical protein